MNAAEFLLAAGDGERIAIECGNRAVSYRELRSARCSPQSISRK
jgi:hypothetical protein